VDVLLEGFRSCTKRTIACQVSSVACPEKSKAGPEEMEGDVVAFEDLNKMEATDLEVNPDATETILEWLELLKDIM
jgi:hypothetical protein